METLGFYQWRCLNGLKVKMNKFILCYYFTKKYKII